jgi:hypothetical protein
MDFFYVPKLKKSHVYCIILIALLTVMRILCNPNTDSTVYVVPNSEHFSIENWVKF